MSVFYVARVAPASEDWREAMQLGVEVFDDGVLWRESFATNAFIATDKPAKVVLSHAPDKVVGHVCNRIAHKGWHYLDFTLDHAQPLSCVAVDLLKVGTPVSLGARSLAHDKSLAEQRYKRHTVARLDELSILSPGEHPAYPGAQITQILKPSAKRTPARPAPVIRRVHRHDEEIAELRRRLDWHEAHHTGASFEDIHAAMLRELRPRHGAVLHAVA